MKYFLVQHTYPTSPEWWDSEAKHKTLAKAIEEEKEVLADDDTIQTRIVLRTDTIIKKKDR